MDRVIQTETAARFDVAGPSGAKPIVFIHGTRITRKVWLRQMEGLADEYRVIALDLPGHGALAGEPFGMEAAVREIARVVDAAADGRALVVGASLGGYVAMPFADRYPDKTAGLVLSGCTLDLRGLAGLGCRIGALGFQLLDERWLVWANRKIYRWLFPPSLAEPIIAAGFCFRAAPAALRELIGREYLTMLRSFPGPVLFLNGARDRVMRLNEARFIAAAKRVRLQLIPRGSHRCHLEYPEVFTEAVREFARSIG